MKKLTPSLFQKEQFLEAVTEHFTHLFTETGDPTTISTPQKEVAVINLITNAQTKEFARLWQDHPEIVRGIGTSCTHVFYIVSPTDPIKFDGPNLF